MVGREASLDGRLFLGGTDGSNSVPSSGESTNHRFLGGGARICRFRSGFGCSFLRGCRSIPGTTLPTSQLEWLSSTTLC
jgi:hypothetical protein